MDAIQIKNKPYLIARCHLCGSSLTGERLNSSAEVRCNSGHKWSSSSAFMVSWREEVMPFSRRRSMEKGSK